MLAPVAGGVEKFADMYVSDDVIDVFAIYKDLGTAAGGEQLGEFVVGNVRFGGDNLVARNHAVAKVGVGEIERVLKYLDFGAYGFFLVVQAVNGVFEVIVEIRYGYHLDFHLVRLEAE